jgi:hypothetical protein
LTASAGSQSRFLPTDSSEEPLFLKNYYRGNDVMPDELKKTEVCKCEDHQEEVRLIIETEVLNDHTLRVTKHHTTFRQSEDIGLGGWSTFARKDYHELLVLGSGVHSICRCQNIGTAGAIHRRPEA